MKPKSKDKTRGWIMAVILLLAFSVVYSYAGSHFSLSPAFTTVGIFSNETPDHLIDSYTTIIDEAGNTISEMARIATAGDELFTAEGRHYRVARVQGNKAEAVFLGLDEQLVAYNDFYAGLHVAVVNELAEKGKGNAFAVYHTHTDESYVPTDGTESIPFKGGIYQVGKRMVEQLQDNGYQVNYDETPHDPHDNNAYVRSRRTAVSLLKTGPTAVFDVHRDGIPDPNYYRSTIDGQQIARLRLVVGRENPRMSANMDFAKQMMASANNLYPNVVKEIFVGKGDYNQDLSPTALLIEAGTHTNTKEEAALGLSMFTESIPIVLGLTSGTANNTSGAPAVDNNAAGGAATGGGAWKALAWLLGFAIVGGLAFLYISTGSMENAKEKLSRFGSELTGLVRPREAMRKLGKQKEKTNKKSDD